MERDRQSGRLALLYSGGGLLVIAAYVAAPAGAPQAVLDGALRLSAVAAILVGLRLFRPPRILPWLLLAAGLGFTALGEAVWVTYELLGRNPFPSPADAFYLAGYAAVVAALVVFVRSRDRARGTIVDAAIVTVAATVLVWVLLVEPAAGSGSPTLAEQVFAAAYPLMDLLLLTLLVGLLLGRGVRSAAFWLLAAGVGFNVVANTAFAAFELTGSGEGGSLVGAAWLLAYLCAGAAGLHPSMAALGETAPVGKAGLTRARLAALALASITAPAVLAVQAVRGDIESVAVIVAGAALLPLLVLARLTGVVRELQRVGTERERLYVSERAARAEAESAQRLLAAQNDRLRELDRLKDEFVALVSHELRTPLTSITGYLELVREDGRLDDEQDRFLEIVDRNSRRLLRLVSDLLLVAQIESGRLALELDDVDLSALAAESVEAIRPAAAAKDLELRLDGPPLPPIRGDSARLGQLLDNLLSNAVKFTPAGGRAVVALGASADAVVLAVSDTGIGVPAAEQRRLFDRFFRTSSAQEQAIEGTGLGLTIAQAIAVAHGGSIDVASAEGEGTTFRVRLPLAGAAREQDTRAIAAWPESVL